MGTAISTISFFRRPDNHAALAWERKIFRWLRTHEPSIQIISGAADMLIVLGGDGTIIEAARDHGRSSKVILGLNLGTVGFLSTVRKPRDFLQGLKRVLAGETQQSVRMMIDVAVMRLNEEVFRTSCLNEVYIQNPLGMVSVDVRANNTLLQRVQGTGVLVATPTGSTGYNLSAHGPIVDPSLHCLIITEILDHNLPTPSIVLPSTQSIELDIRSFRQRGTFLLASSPMQSDVVLAADGQILFPLLKHDCVTVTRSKRSIRLLELGAGYFTHSLHEKFSLT